MHNKILMLSFYSLILNALFRPLNGTISVIFGYITIILTILYPIIRSKTNEKLLIDKTPAVFTVVIILSMVSSIGSFSVNNLNNQIISIISFIVLYWSISISQTNNRDVIHIQDICKANYILCLILLSFGYGPFSFKYSVVNNWGNTIFTMGLGNPNVVSVYVMFAIIVLLIHIVYQKKTLLRIMDFLIISLLINLLFKLSSRTIVLCVIILILCYLVDKKTVDKKNKKMKFIWAGVLAWPIIMVFITIMVLGEREITVRLLGKSLETGRFDMYLSVIEDIKSSPLKFIFGQVLKYKFTNMHNAPLTIITNVGLVGFAVYIAFWYKKFSDLNCNCKTPEQKIAIYAMLVFIIHSSSESLLMIGTIPYVIMVIIVDRIAKGEIVDKSTYLSNNE